MKKVVILILLASLFSCNKKNEISYSTNSIEKPYIISVEDRIYSKRLKKNEVPFVPIGFSAESNILIDKDGNVYYYQREYFYEMCGTGIENDTLPKFLDLHPKDLIKLPKEYLKKFIDANVMTKEKRRQILVIASQNDTIKDKVFLKFCYHLKVPTYLIRRTTQEEDTVLDYKKNKTYYYSDSIKWDKTKIKFIKPSKN